jgi:GNAT superfamily N-acetyltransferase
MNGVPCESSSKPEVSTATIRHACADDLLELFKLCVAMHAETDFSGLAFDPDRALAGLTAWVTHERGLMAVAEFDGEVVGLLAATEKQPWFSLEWIASEDLFFVREDKRGGHVAYRLMEFFDAWNRERGVRYGRAGIATGKPGASAGRLYEHFGFRKVGGSYAKFYDRVEGAMQ